MRCSFSRSLHIHTTTNRVTDQWLHAQTKKKCCVVLGISLVSKAMWEKKSGLVSTVCICTKNLWGVYNHFLCYINLHKWAEFFHLKDAYHQPHFIEMIMRVQQDNSILILQNLFTPFFAVNMHYGTLWHVNDATLYFEVCWSFRMRWCRLLPSQ